MFVFSDFNITSNSPDETIKVGQRIGERLKGGEIIAVCGQLGTGKTHLIKGIATGAGAKGPTTVSSPTFVIVNEYRGRFHIYHVDAYRLDSIDQFEMLGFDDYCYPGSVVLIEWADKVESALRGIEYLRVELTHVAKTRRDIHIKNAPAYITPY
jgi:tRNA threonylcarbamoyladenosine biosynthesis protein TsaE